MLAHIFSQQVYRIGQVGTVRTRTVAFAVLVCSDSHQLSGSALIGGRRSSAAEVSSNGGRFYVTHTLVMYVRTYVAACTCDFTCNLILNLFAPGVKTTQLSYQRYMRGGSQCIDTIIPVYGQRSPRRGRSWPEAASWVLFDRLCGCACVSVTAVVYIVGPQKSVPQAQLAPATASGLPWENAFVSC